MDGPSTAKIGFDVFYGVNYRDPVTSSAAVSRSWLIDEKSSNLGSSLH